MIVSLLSMITFPNLSTALPVGFEQQSIQIQAQHENMFQFQQQTSINISTNVNIEGVINCESAKIFNKEFTLEITDADTDLTMNMTCTEEQTELGLLLGNRITARNRNRLRYQEALCINISCNNTQIQAQLKIKATEKNRNGNWAYYDDNEQDWVTVPTTLEDGYLVANTDHLSTWTILLQEQQDFSLYIGIGIVVAAVALIGVVGIMYYKRR